MKMKPRSIEARAGLSAAIVTLGCPKNTIDSERMLAVLQRSGVRIGVPLDQADVIVVNTCGFIDPAKQESIDAILDAARYKKGGRCRRLVVAGCMVERHREELARELPEVDAFVGVHQVGDLVSSVLAGLAPRDAAGDAAPSAGRAPRARAGAPPGRVLSTPPYRAYLKISEGCDNGCAYCAIPLIRGRLRSRPPSDIEHEARALAEGGVLEITLVAQDSTSYGRDLGLRHNLPSLLARLHRIDEIRWIRLLYLHPARVDRRLLETMAALPKICAYLDIPFQHVSAPILTAMGRKGNAEAYLRMVAGIRDVLPDCSLRSSFIVGFPGEKREHFQELVDFLKTAKLDYAGAFVYSPQEGTRAAKRGDPISPRVKERRWHRFMEIQAEITAESNRARIGDRVEVLVEGKAAGRRGWSWGRTRGQAPEIDGVVFLRGRLDPGNLVEALVTDSEVYDLVGRLA